MSATLPKQVRELAERDNISINQFIATALAEKMAVLLAGEYLAERAERGDARKFQRVLKKVRNVKPDPGDEI